MSNKKRKKIFILCLFISIKILNQITILLTNFSKITKNISIFFSKQFNCIFQKLKTKIFTLKTKSTWFENIYFSKNI